VPGRLRALRSFADRLEQVYRDYREPLFACALAITRSTAHAEDAVHEAFCRLLGQNSRPRDLKAYVFRTVRNAAIDQVGRHRQRGEALPEFMFDPDPAPDQAATEGEFRRQVAAALHELSADEYETIIQHIYGGLTFREVAAIRQAPQGTVAGWYQRGLKKLRAKLED
jgi:RNA polymerase sigma factor (sigma-70 family)